MLGYAPRSIKIQSNVTFRQKRQLPGRLLGELNTPSGQQTTMVQIVVKATLPSGIQEVDVAKGLGIRSSSIEEALMVSVGDRVRPNQELAKVSGRFGREKVVTAPAEGLILDLVDGVLMVSSRPREKVIRALLHGWVVGKTPDKGVTIEAQGTRVDGIWNNGEEGYGTLRLITDRPDQVPDPDRITSEAQSSILAVGRLEDPEMIRNAEDRGVRGFVVGSISEAILSRMAEISVPIFVTDGAGPHGMTSMIFDKLGESQGSEASILAAETSASRGPLLYIFSNNDLGATMHSPGGLPTALIPGASVRFLCQPYIGMIGQVISTAPETQDAHILSELVHVDVRLQDGRIVGVRSTNLDIIM